jgi:hypothetical protein
MHVMNKLLLTLQEVINDVAVLDGLKLSHHNCVCESSKLMTLRFLMVLNCLITIAYVSLQNQK